MADQKTAKAGQSSSGLNAFAGGLNFFGDLLQAQEIQRQAGDQMRTLLTEGIRSKEQHNHRAVTVAEAGAQVEAAQRTAFANAGVEVSSGTPANQIERTAVAAERASLSEVFAGDQALIDSQRAARRVAKAAKRTAKLQDIQLGAELIFTVGAL